MFKDVFGYSSKSYVSQYIIDNTDIAIKQSELLLVKTYMNLIRNLVRQYQFHKEISR